jgi:hypothetical protein
MPIYDLDFGRYCAANGLTGDADIQAHPRSRGSTPSATRLRPNTGPLSPPAPMSPPEPPLPRLPPAAILAGSAQRLAPRLGDPRPRPCPHRTATPWLPCPGLLHRERTGYARGRPLRLGTSGGRAHHHLPGGDLPGSSLPWRPWRPRRHHHQAQPTDKDCDQI